MHTTLAATRRHPVKSAVILFFALVVGFLAWGVPKLAADAAPASAVAAASNGHGHGHAARAALPRNAAQLAFHDQMRKLWEDHVTWTRLAIVTFADGSASFPATAERLLQNQTDLGDAIKPYYGEAAGDQLTALLHDHITIAVEILQAVDAGDDAAFTDAKTRWYQNGNDIAEFLTAANPKNWPAAAMKSGMSVHLDQTLAEAAHELSGDYAASVADYEEAHLHMLDLADTLSGGIIAQFPKQFR
jgi:hypothetical protein